MSQRFMPYVVCYISYGWNERGHDIIDSGNGLPPVRHEAITLYNADY